jgi:membrane protease YdiL (CAAX protease family)
MHRGWWLDSIGGIGITGVAIAVVFLVAEGSGWLVVGGWSWENLALDAFAGTLWVSLGINVLVALGEEVIFRAYLLNGLDQVWGHGRAIAAMMLVFGVLHLPSYANLGMGLAALVGAVSLACAFGALFGIAYLRTRSLWLPTGVHFAWNFFENDVFNLPGSASNPNLVGALTRLQGPLDSVDGSGVVLDLFAFALLCVGMRAWLATRRHWT